MANFFGKRAVGGGVQHYAWEGGEGIFRTADLEILIYDEIQTPKLRLNPDS